MHFQRRRAKVIRLNPNRRRIERRNPGPKAGPERPSRQHTASFGGHVGQKGNGSHVVGAQRAGQGEEQGRLERVGRGHFLRRPPNHRQPLEEAQATVERAAEGQKTGHHQLVEAGSRRFRG